MRHFLISRSHDEFREDPSSLNMSGFWLITQRPVSATSCFQTECQPGPLRVPLLPPSGSQPAAPSCTSSISTTVFLSAPFFCLSALLSFTVCFFMPSLSPALCVRVNFLFSFSHHSSRCRPLLSSLVGLTLLSSSPADVPLFLSAASFLPPNATHSCSNLPVLLFALSSATRSSLACDTGGI